jgi:hypothetical protein
MTAHVHVGDGALVTIVNPMHDSGVEWTLRYGDPESVRFVAASLLASYHYLLSTNITTEEAIRRLRILRNSHRSLIESAEAETDA